MAICINIFWKCGMSGGKKMRFKKQITYDSDKQAIEKLLHLSEVFYIKRANIIRIQRKYGDFIDTRWRLIVEWE